MKNVFKPDRCGNASPLHIAKVLFPPEKVKRLLKKVRFLEFQELKKKLPPGYSQRQRRWKRGQQSATKTLKAFGKVPKR